MASPSEAAATLHRQAAARRPTLGRTRLVCIDGPAGAGKTTIAEALTRRESAARLVHMDDLYEGWSGLAGVEGQLATLLTPLAAGRPGRYRRYDWYAAAYAEEVTVPPSPWLVLEGVGAGHRAFAELHTVLAWITAPLGARHRRWVEREGSARWWEPWQRDQGEHFAADRTRDRADVVVAT